MKVERDVIAIIFAAFGLMALVPWVAGQTLDGVFFTWPFFFEVAIGGLL